MADLTAIAASRNAGVDFAWTTGAASQTINFDAADDKYLILAQNNNDAEAEVATVTVSKGDFPGAVADLTKTVAYNGAIAVIGPLEGWKYKDKDTGKVTVGITVASTGAVASTKIAVIKLP